MDYSWSRSDRYNQLRSHSLSECIQFGSGETVIAASLDSQIGYKMNRLTFKQQSYRLFFVVFHKQEFCEHVIDVTWITSKTWKAYGSTSLSTKDRAYCQMIQCIALKPKAQGLLLHANV